MDMPWTALAKVDANREYQALLSYLPLKTYSALPRFFLFTFQIQKQLRGTAGVAGYALRAKPLSRKFWTLSAWDDDQALMDFVRKLPHLEAMQKLAARMDRTEFTRWKAPGSSLPLKWEEAMQRAQQGAHQ